MGSVSPLYFQRRELAGLTEAADLSAELRAFLEWLDEAAPGEPVPAEYRPAVDVSETPPLSTSSRTSRASPRTRCASSTRRGPWSLPGASCAGL